MRSDRMEIKMINDILDKLITYSNGTIVTSSNCDKIISESVRKKYEIETVNDARSATFYAFGKSTKLFKPTILLLDEKGITSSYTGLTEAFYQKIPIIVIVISKGQKKDFLNFCIGKRFFISNRDELANVVEVFSKTYDQIKFEPIEIEVREDYLESQKMVEDTFLSSLKWFLTHNDLLFVSNMNIDADRAAYDYEIRIDNSEAYGIVSKYCGYIVNSSYITVLACTSQDVYLDINIFNCRYISNKLKIFVYEVPGYTLDIKEWLELNGIAFLTDTNLNSNIVKTVMESEVPILAYIK